MFDMLKKKWTQDRGNGFMSTSMSLPKERSVNSQVCRLCTCMSQKVAA